MKTLVLDQGNSTLFAGVFRDDRLMRSARINMGEGDSARRLQQLARGKVDRVALCSVVPKQTSKWIAWAQKTLGVAPIELMSTSAHGLSLAYAHPEKLGADRVANALGARKLYPNKHVMVVDCGTATTLTLLHRDGTLLGGSILPGLGMWPEMLSRRTARLPAVKPGWPETVVGTDTESAIRSGIMVGHAGAIRELVFRSRAEAFGRSPAVVVGTGGQVRHFKCQSLFTSVETGLILHGLQAFASENPAHA